ncbi:uncharacterized protein STEHIDRAFT_151221 [Stereum hirsutum FP-91666 SS1]|uniref:uncharacterized protein n=1 Tax=Stereum hirsutum (strain FP-91666) TaxID=721885 RepID=UPI000440E682|nr:uncharacterized protein STEHIDRAFT_151221 [Stereum hirsutum FP-91666 SS1]EIM91864.1 hypothetical protein STEHIDRAFT_151221 [Stereum hirsutum FP-91666 SS1]
MKLYLSLLFAVVAVAFPLIESEVKRCSGDTLDLPKAAMSWDDGDVPGLTSDICDRVDF